MSKISTVAVITDDEFFRDASAYFLAQQNYAVLNIGPDEQEIRTQLLHQRPDLVIVRTRRGPQSTCALQCIHEHNLPTRTVAYTDAAADQAPTPRHAYLTRADGLEALLRCVAVLEGGHAATAPAAAPTAAAAPDPLAVLGSQERKVLALIGRGLSAKQMAEQLFVSTHTIKNHKTNITRKLAVASGRDLLTVALALREHPALKSALMS
ncbi:response regulator transcription factor [Hymenobacter gummosus]|uniref:Response regulator transcription factor n=1 Tax=Hymenobacter gummosus TaxID=1776032 RepID=A0A431TWX1_9BACT|nr:LuxR C-terminal-related transcriptional regulator [Hymenobacter gummosus]RTQ45902.1 response regulator transcription factor [Hymenobacter gummosus]